MSLYDEPPPHRMDLYSNTTAEDVAGGLAQVESLVQADIAVSVNRGGAAQPSRLGQKQMVVPARIGVWTKYLTQYPQRMWVGKVTHTETGQVQVAIFAGGYTVGEAYGDIDSLTYFSVEFML